MKDEDRIPPSIREKFTEEILDLVLYDVENCQALRDFEPIKMNTHCIFAKKAILWGACDYDHSLSVGKTWLEGERERERECGEHVTMTRASPWVRLDTVQATDPLRG